MALSIGPTNGIEQQPIKIYTTYSYEMITLFLLFYVFDMKDWKTLLNFEQK